MIAILNKGRYLISITSIRLDTYFEFRFRELRTNGHRVIFAAAASANTHHFYVGYAEFVN